MSAARALARPGGSRQEVWDRRATPFSRCE
jgi:hypothetical protein